MHCEPSKFISCCSVLQAEVGVVAKNADKIYKYMNFDQIEEYADVAKSV